MVDSTDGGRPEWQAARRAQMARDVADRLVVAVLLAGATVAAGVVLEAVANPATLHLAFAAFGVKLAVCAMALLLVRLPSLRPHAGWVACGFGVCMSVIVGMQDAAAGRDLASAAAVQMGLQVAIFVVLQWGWREQLVVTLATLAAPLLTLAVGAEAAEGARAMLLLACVGVATTTGASLLDRERRAAWIRARLLERASAERAAMLEAALDAVLTLDDAGRITEANAAASAMFGYERARLIGRPLGELLDVRPTRLADLRLDDRMRLDALATREDGSTFVVEVTMAPVRREGPRTFACTIRDITERTKVERQLQESKRHAEEEAEIASALLYATETLSAHLNQPFMLERVTCRAVEAVGCDWGAAFVWEERAGETFALRAGFGIPPDVYAAVRATEVPAEVVRAARGQWPGSLVECIEPRQQRLLPPALLERWSVTSVLCVPIRRGGEVAGVLCLGYRGRRGPFSARQRRLALGIAQATATALENARLITDLRAANRLKSEFVSTMSHELRTPLHVILGFAEMANDVQMAGGQRTECLDRIDHAARELLALIESTLEIGRLEAGRDGIETSCVSIPALVVELQAMCASMPREPGVALVWCDRIPAARINTDQRKLSIVLRNLVGNALKFTRRGSVRFDVRVRPTHVEFTVSDTGIGIKPEDRDAIFEMFRQADQSDSRRFGGTGLGLYIVRRYVDQLGGTIQLESAPGLGSTFTVCVPRGAVPDEEERAA